MNSTIKRAENKNIELSITIPWSEVEKTKDEVIEALAKQADIEGFRKGKAPKKLVEERLDKEKIKEEVLKKLLPETYLEAVQKHNIRPIVNPKIHVAKFEEGKDWEFTATTCEAPEIDLAEYKDNIQKITAKGKIVIPGKEQQPPKFDDIVKALLSSVKITIPAVLVDSETERLLVQTLDEIKRLGLTLDQYLSSTGRSIETLKNEYKKKAGEDIKLEFALQKIAESENITVDTKEIEEAIQKAKNEEEREHLKANRYLLASVLRQQKTLDFLRNL